MATPWTDSNLPLLPFPNVPALPNGQQFEGALVRTPDGNGYVASAAQLTAQLMPVLGTATGQAPAITLELSAATVAAGNNVVLTARVTQGTAAIKQVEFFDGGDRVGQPLTTQPYQYTYLVQTSGKHALVAKVTDASGNAVTSAPQYLTVTAVGAVQPTVTLNPVTPTSATLGTSFTLVASASVAGGSIAKVEFFDGAAKIGEDASTPYAVSFTPGSTGQHVLSAKATDLNGNSAISTTQTITITAVAAGPNQLPTVSLTLSPATITLGQSTTLTSMAADTDGTISKVEFFDNNTSLQVVTAAPYQYVYSPSTAGSRTLKAVATDNQGATATATQTLAVSAAPLPTPDAPTFTNYDTTARTATVAPPSGYVIADLVYVLNGATPVAVPSSGVINVGNAAVPFGALKVYVKASSTRNKGQEVVNEVAYQAVTTMLSFNTTYNPGDNISTGTWNAAPNTQLKLNLPLSTNTDPNPATMLVYAPDGTQIGQFDYNGADSNVAAFAIVYNGQTYYNGTMVDSAGTRTGSLLLTNGNVTIAL